MAERIRLILNSRVTWLDVVQAVAEDMARRAGLGEDERFAVSMALREGVNNAILHGNRRDAAKTVEVTLVLHRDRLEIRIKDLGGGYDTGRLPDPLAPRNILSSSGRGIFLIRNYMDDVDLTRVKRRGGEIRMTKWLPGKHRPAAPAGARAGVVSKRGSTSR